MLQKVVECRAHLCTDPRAEEALNAVQPVSPHLQCHGRLYLLAYWDPQRTPVERIGNGTGLLVNRCKLYHR